MCHFWVPVVNNFIIVSGFNHAICVASQARSLRAGVYCWFHNLPDGVMMKMLPTRKYFVTWKSQRWGWQGSYAGQVHAMRILQWYYHQLGIFHKHALKNKKTFVDRHAHMKSNEDFMWVGEVTNSMWMESSMIPLMWLRSQTKSSDTHPGSVFQLTEGCLCKQIHNCCKPITLQRSARPLHCLTLLHF